MSTEKEKMLSGKLYKADDRELVKDRNAVRVLLKAYNNSLPTDQPERERILKDLLPSAAKEIWIEPPFYCDYGYNIELEQNVYFNFNCVLLDVTTITIGKNTMIGPQVQLYTATHPMDHKTRSLGLEYAKPIQIGEEVWIGGGAIICPGVTIGDRSVIGAGSVVTRDIPDAVFATGNPCRVIRQLNGDK